MHFALTPAELGRVVQVDTMKPKLKPPGTNHLKLMCDMLLSTSAFKLNVRRYSWAARASRARAARARATTSGPTSSSWRRGPGPHTARRPPRPLYYAQVQLTRGSVARPGWSTQ